MDATQRSGGVDRSSEGMTTWHRRLRPWADKIQMLAENSKQTYVLFNNCTDGKAAQNAKQMLSLLGLA